MGDYTVTTPHPQAQSPAIQGRPWHALPAEAVAELLGTDPARGLSEADARRRLQHDGPNRLHEVRREPLWRTLLGELREPMIALLLVTGILYGVWGDPGDALTIFGVILFVVGVEIYNERRAAHAIAALHELAAPTAVVRRDGHHREVRADTLVAGDVILVEAGRRVPADARLLEAVGLAADEAALTGESVPVEKTAAPPLPEDTPLAERRTLVFAGTTVTRGRASAIVVATGMATELGRIAGLAREVRAPRTPLQVAMRELSRWLVWLALAFSVLVPILGVFIARQPLQQMLLTGLSLAFATIPEEMPIIITTVLALGGYRLARRRAIVKRLQAVETVGAVTVLATDKTGTLTENRMVVRQLVPPEHEAMLLELGALCNSALEADGDFVGDPLETALLRAARAAGIDTRSLRTQHPVHQEFPFDNVRKRMAVVYARNGTPQVALKGAPEAVLAASTRQLIGGRMQALPEQERHAILEAAARMAAAGLRVIAFAEKTVGAIPLAQGEAESDLTFVGLAGLADPPRPEARQAIATAQSAGIRILMITGDHPLTARAIATQVGLDGQGRVLTGLELDRLSNAALQETVGSVSLYARTTPEHKLRLVRALHARGERVAVTGDGINDAPALAAADIGVAMGETGTDVAREVADIVLADDNFATLVHAVEEGRLLFDNLKKAVRYYLAVKVALISTTLLPVLLGVPVPFAPVQIILMELFMDLAASSTFVAERPEADLMHRPPREPRLPFMDRAMVTSILSAAAGLFAAAATAYLVTWYAGAGVEKARTVAFVAWLLGHVLLALNMRSEREPLLRLGVFSNRLMVIWGAATLGFILLVTLVPAARGVFKTVPLGGAQWLLVVATALLGSFWMEVRKWVRDGAR